MLPTAHRPCRKISAGHATRAATALTRTRGAGARLTARCLPTTWATSLATPTSVMTNPAPSLAASCIAAHAFRSSPATTFLLTTARACSSAFHTMWTARTQPLTCLTCVLCASAASTAPRMALRVSQRLAWTRPVRFTLQAAGFTKWWHRAMPPFLPPPVAQLSLRWLRALQRLRLLP